MPWTINNIDAKSWILNFISVLRFMKSSTNPIKAINNDKTNDKYNVLFEIA